ncbi:thyroid adenoma-associated protein homolog [Dendronephthya gigantea]|uniref:thyroid adenoma-associated protein homolog n=1 Tax=Dendronephthya gigantea TaxID=151771 RepID=UPI00106A6FCD|nr:thyroid adenoma-associated protein homolog [Dendronephthya gigantea]
MKKPKERLEQKLEIPEGLLEPLKDVPENSECASIAKLLSMITDFKDVNKQVASMKKAIVEWKKLLPNSIKPALSGLFIKVLCHMFMQCDAKNPCRRTIASFFQSLPDRAQEEALEQLNQIMLETFNRQRSISDRAEKVVENVNLRKHVDTICSLLENFPLGERCVSLSVKEVLSFLVVALECQVVTESLVGTPTLQTAAMLDCLVTIKATINVLQKCKDFLAELLRKDDALNSFLQRFAKVIFGVLKNDVFFPDCRSAAGMAFPLVVRTSTTQDLVVQCIVCLFFPSYMTIEKLSADKTLSNNLILNGFEPQDITDMSGFSYLSICHGVITMLTRDSLVTQQKFIHCAAAEMAGNLLLDVLFPEITSLCLRLKDSSTVVALRTLAYWTMEVRKCVSDSTVEDCFKRRMRENSDIIQKLLNLVWNFWDHPLEAMRYHTREIFDNAINIHINGAGNEPACDPFIADLSKKLCEVNMFVRGKYGPLCCLLDVVGAQAMLEIHPSIPKDVMTVMSDQTVVPHAMEFAERMFISHLQQISKTSPDYLTDWFELWVVPALRSLSSSEKHVRKHIAEYYVPSLLKCCPECLGHIIKRLHASEPSSEDEFILDNVRCLATSLKTARHLGLLPKADILSEDESTSSDLWLGSVSLAVLERGLCHLDDEIRSDILGLICDSVRTTEPLTAQDLELLRKFYPVNMNSQSPSFRQRVIAMTKKLFIRVRDGGRSWNRKLFEANPVKSDILTTQVKLYIEFLEWFAKLQFQSLFPGASFARRTTALQNLQLFIQIFPNNEEDKFAIFDGYRIFNSQTVHVLLACITDSYDINKQMAFDLLVACPTSIQPFQNTDYILKWMTTATQYAISPKAINVSTAAFMFKILIRKSSYRIDLPLNLEQYQRTSDPLLLTPAISQGSCAYSDGVNKSSDEESSMMPSAYQLNLVDNKEETTLPYAQAFRLLSQFVMVLKYQVEVARKSLLRAAFEAPIHGLLYCIREVLCDLDLSVISGDTKWQALVSAILQACYDVTSVVSPVVTNSSPEGNLCDNDHMVDGESPEVAESFAPKAQILLVCCWRAMKEVSLLLGEITKRATVKEKDQSYGLLTFVQFEEIGELFTNILLTSKHRGAYELAHEGFVKLCHMLWRCEQKEIQRLPEVFLKRLLADISSDNPAPWLCGTRRSAGLPFFFKAIVTTEPNTTGKYCFKSVMRELLMTAAKPVNTEDSDNDTTLPQVHARNILRALYKETKLGEDVFPYVSDGVKVAVEGFLSKSWAVRNCSTLLFSALVNRIFGPQSFQEEKRRQGMTGREFFSRFPSLHSFLIEQLEISLKHADSESISSVHLHPSLYPVLLLLSRLHPSAMDGNDSTLNMAAFIPYVLRCSRSCVLKTRAIAARAIVPLVSGAALQDVVKDLVQSLPETPEERIKQNHLHGCLLQIRELLHGASVNMSLSNRTKKDIFTTIAPLLAKPIWLASKHNQCDISRAVFLSIVRLFIDDQTWFSSESHTDQLDSDISEAFLPSLETAIEEVLWNENVTKVIFPTGRTLVEEEIARIALHPHYNSSLTHDRMSRKKVVSRIMAFLSMPAYEVKIVALEVLYKLFSKDTGMLLGKENSDVIVNGLLIHMLDSKMKGECLAMLYKCLSLVAQSLRFPWALNSNRVVEFHEAWSNIVQSFKTMNHRSDVMCSLLHFSCVLISGIRQETLNKSQNEDFGQMVKDLVSFIEMCTENEEDEILRLAVAQVLGSGNVTFILVEPLLGYENQTFRIWKVLIYLLIDDSVEVKQSMASGLLNILPSFAQDNSKNYSVHSALALRFAVRTPLELFWVRHPVMTLQWLLDLMDQTQTDITSDVFEDTAYDDMKNIDKLFEKGPVNTHREDCILAETIFQEFFDWVVNANGANSITEPISELFIIIKNFVRNHIANSNDNLPQDSAYTVLYITVISLGIMKILIENSDLERVNSEGGSDGPEIFTTNLLWLQELRKSDQKHLFDHCKLVEISKYVLGESY